MSKLNLDLKIKPPKKKILQDKQIDSNFAEIVPDLKMNNFYMLMWLSPTVNSIV